MTEPYWCLFCGEEGERFPTMQAMMNHMMNTVHKDDKGNIVVFTGDQNEFQ